MGLRQEVYCSPFEQSTYAAVYSVGFHGLLTCSKFAHIPKCLAEYMLQTVSVWAIANNFPECWRTGETSSCGFLISWADLEEDHLRSWMNLVFDTWKVGNCTFRLHGSQLHGFWWYSQVVPFTKHFRQASVLSNLLLLLKCIPTRDLLHSACRTILKVKGCPFSSCHLWNVYQFPCCSLSMCRTISHGNKAWQTYSLVWRFQYRFVSLMWVEIAHMDVSTHINNQYIPYTHQPLYFQKY